VKKKMSMIKGNNKIVSLCSIVDFLTPRKHKVKKLNNFIVSTTFFNKKV